MDIENLAHCPTCGRRITDYDDEGMEHPETAQRWCINHFEEVEVAKVKEVLRTLFGDRLEVEFLGDPGGWMAHLELFEGLPSEDRLARQVIRELEDEVADA